MTLIVFKPCCSLASVKGKTRKKRKRDEDSDEADEFSDSGSEIGKHLISASSVQCTLPSIVRHMLTMLCLNPKPQAFLCPSLSLLHLPVAHMSLSAVVPLRSVVLHEGMVCTHSFQSALPAVFMLAEFHSWSTWCAASLMSNSCQASEMDPDKCKFSYSALACISLYYISGSCDNEPQ